MSFTTSANSLYGNIKIVWDAVFHQSDEGRRYVADHVAGLTWDDVRAPASGINPPGAVSDPDIDPTTGELLFADNKTEQVAIFLQMPHSWVPGTLMQPHVHWKREDAGDVYWRLQYKFYALGEEVAGSYTTIFETLSDYKGTYIANSPTVVLHDYTEFPAIDTTGLTPTNAVSPVFECILARVGGDDDDDYSGDCRFLEFDIHFQGNGHGSFAEDERQLIGIA